MGTGSDASSLSSLNSNSGSEALEEQSDAVSVLSQRMRANIQSLDEMNDVGYIAVDQRAQSHDDNFLSSPLPVDTRSSSIFLVANNESRTSNRGTGMHATFQPDSLSRVHKSQIEIQVREYHRLHAMHLKRTSPSQNAPVNCVQVDASNIDVEADADESSDTS